MHEDDAIAVELGIIRAKGLHCVIIHVIFYPTLCVGFHVQLTRVIKKTCGKLQTRTIHKGWECMMSQASHQVQMYVIV